MINLRSSPAAVPTPLFQSGRLLPSFGLNRSVA